MLKPCPFCCSLPKIARFHAERGKQLECRNCGALGPKYDNAEPNGGSRWNRRPIEDALTARAEKAERERDEARARLAAAVEWAAANKPFGGNGTISNEIHASMAEGDRLDVILSDAPALAVVEGSLWFDGEANNQVASIEARLPGTAEDWPEDRGYTVVVLHANAVLERGVDHPTLSEG